MRICIVFLIILIKIVKSDNDFCEKDNKNCAQNDKSYRYILYDINRPEGFNLRRDVYMRLATFLHIFQTKKMFLNFKLVLPPWSDLYHWRSNENNLHIPWSQFFDLKSLQLFAPVIEMNQFFDEIGQNYKKINLDEVYILQNFQEMFRTGKFVDKIEIQPCVDDDFVDFFNYSNMTSKNIKCLSFHGHASQLAKILQKSDSRTFLFHHAEIVLHERYGDNIYWQARRSMRFNKELRNIAKEFRFKYLNSSDETDNTFLPDDWRDEKPHRNAKGGLYLSVHLRRRDFLRGRPSEIPDLANAGKQIIKLLEKHHLETVFVATDSPLEEFDDLRKIIPQKYKVLKYTPSKEILKRFKDGGVAIIEQIICSHAQYFIGTHESTFSFRIQEEREILGFPPETTFNSLCGKKCQKPSVWKIVY